MQETEGIRKDTVINSVHIYRQISTGRNIRFPSVTKSLKLKYVQQLTTICTINHLFFKIQHTEYLQAYVNIYKTSQDVSVKNVCTTCQSRF